MPEKDAGVWKNGAVQAGIRTLYLIFGLSFCLTFTGCGVRDSALVIPIGESGETDIPDVRAAADAERSGGQETAQEELPGVSPEAEGRNPKETSEEQVYVYVCGAVREPGVVKLPRGSRAEDALLAAGGFAEDAQKDYVNLAAGVEDGEKLYFPSEEEYAGLMQAELTAQEALVNINTADLTLLMTLPGIGESRARDIIAYREKNGAFESGEDLKKVSGIKDSVYAKLCDRITVR